jgi:sialate O-acetylesterase
MKTAFRVMLASFWLHSIASLAQAELELARLFSDHMVLQREMPLPVWGWAAPGEEITVTIDKQNKIVTADETGKWLVRLDPLEVGTPRKLTVRGKTESLTINDVLVGEVWVCSGQSNMEWPLSASTNGKVEVASADHPELRLFQVGNPVTPDGPAEKLLASAQQKCVWQTCTPATAANFSAVGYYFGIILQKKLNVPVGLIHNAVGATPIEAWISREVMQRDANAQYLVERWDNIVKFSETEKGKAELAEVYAEYDAQQKEALANKKWFWRSDDYQAPSKRLGYPATFFNGRVKPLMPYAIRGVIWYQGEGNWAMPYAYRTLFRLLIQDWRRQWGQGDFPFLFVQLPNFGMPAKEPEVGGWAELRESQASVLDLPNTGMAVALDQGDAKDIHPTNKAEVARRLTLAAQKIAYQQKILATGPLYREMKIEGKVIFLRFHTTGHELWAKDGQLQRFAIAGADRKFVWANAKIEGDTIVVQSDAVPQPVAVRYAWASNPEGCNLYNDEGLPAAPFRTDDWPSPTAEKTYLSELSKPITFKLWKPK